MKYSPFFIFPVLMLLASCSSMSSMQTGRTVGKNNAEVGGGFSVCQFTAYPDSLPNKTYTYPIFEFFGHYGLTEKMDVGMKFGFGGVGGDLKYQIVGSQQSPFALSLGLILGYGSLTSTVDSTVVFQNRFSQTAIPLYFSYHPVENLAFYVTPRWDWRNAGRPHKGTFLDVSVGGVAWFGASTGIRFGKKKGFFIEYSWLKSNSDNRPAHQQFLVGMNYRFH